MRNARDTMLSQQVLSDKLLLTDKKSNIRDELK